MVSRASALDGHYKSGHFGVEDTSGVTLEIIRDISLHQVSAWPETVDSLGNDIAKSVTIDGAPGPCMASENTEGKAMLRIEPLKWWVFGTSIPEIDVDQGVTVDLSHSRTCIRISGDEASALLNRLLSIDLRSSSFPNGGVASSSIHHVGVTLWRSESGYMLFMPRGFALSVWEVLFESALQFGVDVK